MAAPIRPQPTPFPRPAATSAPDALRSIAIPPKLTKPAHFLALVSELYRLLRAVDADYSLFKANRFLDMVGDGDRRWAAMRIAAMLDAYAQNHAATLSRPIHALETRQPATNADAKRGSRELRLDLLLFLVVCTCTLNGSVHEIAKPAAPMMAVRGSDIPYVLANAIVRTATPVLAMSARELVAHYRQLEMRLAILPYDGALPRYVDLLRLRCAMLLRAEWPYQMFDALEYCERHSEVQGVAMYIYSRRFLEDSAWFFAGVDARLYTAVLWERVDVHADSEAAAQLRVALLGSDALDLRKCGQAMNAFLLATSETLSIDLVNAQFRERYLVHCIRASERQRFLRDKPRAVLSAAKILKTFRGAAGVNAALELADTDAKDALQGKSTLDVVAVDMMRLRVMDAYANSFHTLPFEASYVYYQDDVMLHYANVLQIVKEPVLVQTFTRFDLLVPAALLSNGGAGGVGGGAGSSAMHANAKPVLLCNFTDAGEAMAAWLLCASRNDASSKATKLLAMRNCVWKATSAADRSSNDNYNDTRGARR